MTIQLKKTSKCHNGHVKFYQHPSEATKTDMNFALFVPNEPVRMLMYWLSGLTCTEENFITKAGALKFASQHGVAILCPDTSPRGTQLPGEHDSWDFGSGAGFYLNATEQPWSQNYNMRSYIVEELANVLETLELAHIPRVISGHSMGGHGALTIGIQEHKQFLSVSAFSPICNPSKSPWGINAFSRYLGPNKDSWLQYDTCEILRHQTYSRPILIHQGTDDEFYESQLMTSHLKEVCQASGTSLELHEATGYDHSYYFISSFIDEHMAFHLKAIDN